MISINLIDWRSQKVLILNRRFAFVTVVTVVVWILLAMLIYLFISLQIGTAKGDMDYLDQQVKLLSGPLNEIKGLQAQKDILLSRRKAIDALQGSRPLVVNIFDNIVRAMPDGVVLNALQRKGDDIIMNGVSDSNYSISVLMENIQHLPWVKTAKLGEIKGGTGAAKDDSDTTAKKTATTAAAPTPSGTINFSLTITTLPPDKQDQTAPATDAAATGATPGAPDAAGASAGAGKGKGGKRNAAPGN